MMKDDSSIQAAGTEMDKEMVQTAEVDAEEVQPEETQPEDDVSGKESGPPRRYKLYDRFADNISLRTIDLVIVITAALIVGLLIYGIVTGGAG